MGAYILLVLGFVLLIKAADMLVDGASSIAHRLRISDLVVGLTIVAFGTSTPELFVNLLASVKGSDDIAIGNIIGSNILNILVILGISSIIFPLTATIGTIRIQTPLTLLAALLLGVLAHDHLISHAAFRGLTRVDGLVLLVCFAVFSCYVFLIARKKETLQEIPELVKRYSVAKSIVLVIVGLAGLFAGAKLVVDAAIVVAGRLGVSDSLIALTIVAAGTSLPELATSAVAAYKKNSDIAVGNIVGSNIFNIFFILGTSASIRPISMQTKSNLDIGVAILASSLLFIAMFTGKKRVLDRWEGAVFVGLYIAYVALLVILD